MNGPGKTYQHDTVADRYAHSVETHVITTPCFESACDSADAADLPPHQGLLDFYKAAGTDDLTSHGVVSLGVRSRAMQLHPGNALQRG